MLTLALAVMLSQCSTDVECKGDRVCSGGQCIDPTPRADAPVRVDASVRLLEADRVARVAQLRMDVAGLKNELEEVSIVSPILKLVGGTVAAVLAFVALNRYSDAVTCQYNGLSGCLEPSYLIGGVVLAGAVSVALFIWGGIQLHHATDARQRLPLEIRAKEEQLMALEGAR